MGNFNKGGFGGFGGGNMQQLMKQAQKMQQDMLEAKEALAELEVTAESGGGLVSVTMTCDKKITALNIKPDAVDVDDMEMLEDLVIAAVNEAMTLADKESEERMGAYSQLGL